MRLKNSFPFLFSLLSLFTVHSQTLQPGFNKDEYTALMKVSAQFGDSAYAAQIPPPAGYGLAYRSPVMGLDNRWDLWRSPEGTPIISIRGTTQKEVSWLANFYAAMVPAKGELHRKHYYTITERRLLSEISGG